MSVPDGRIAKGVSLWLMPEGEARARLARCIDRLAVRLATPSFPPHVTLLPGLDAPVDSVLDAVAELARGLPPFEVRLSGVEGSDDHFRCLYARVEVSSPLGAAHARAVRRLVPPGPLPFEPHLSLVYGTLDAGTKAALAREVEAEALPGFQARRLHAWRTEGEVGAWHEIGSCALEGSDETGRENPGWTLS